MYEKITNNFEFGWYKIMLILEIAKNSYNTDKFGLRWKKIQPRTNLFKFTLPIPDLSALGRRSSDATRDERLASAVHLDELVVDAARNGVVHLHEALLDLAALAEREIHHVRLRDLYPIVHEVVAAPGKD